MRKVIERLLLDRDIKKGELAEQCGWKGSTFSLKLKKDRFTLDDLQKISDALGLGLEVSFIDQNGDRITVFRKDEDEQA